MTVCKQSFAYILPTPSLCMHFTSRIAWSLRNPQRKTEEVPWQPIQAEISTNMPKQPEPKSLVHPSHIGQCASRDTVAEDFQPPSHQQAWQVAVL